MSFCDEVFEGEKKVVKKEEVTQVKISQILFDNLERKKKKEQE